MIKSGIIYFINKSCSINKAHIFLRPFNLDGGFVFGFIFLRLGLLLGNRRCFTQDLDRLSFWFQFLWSYYFRKHNFMDSCEIDFLGHLNNSQYFILEFYIIIEPLNHWISQDFSMLSILFYDIGDLYLFIDFQIIFNIQYSTFKTQIMNYTSNFINVLICILYGSISILQTINSKYLFHTLGFDYYSFVFAIQRVAIIIICWFFKSRKLNRQIIILVLPFAACQCISNILSSYCITIMPIAAFLAFKKIQILFILLISCILRIPTKINNLQNVCMFFIVFGGVMVGQRDLLNGDFIGYVSCIIFDLCDALVLQYSAYLFRVYQCEPQQLLMYNAMVSLPYYVLTIFYEGEVNSIQTDLSTSMSVMFLVSLIGSIFLACLSQFSSNYIAMKISPFEKSTVSNIKDVLLTLISVFLLREFMLTPISTLGLVLCLISSAIFANQQLKHKTIQMEIAQQLQSPAITQQMEPLQQQHISGPSSTTQLQIDNQQ